MKAALGYAAVAFGAGASVVGITALLAGLQLRDKFLLRFGRRCVFAVFVAALAAAGVMEWALLSHDFSIRYVAENNATRHAAALHDHRAVGRARGIDPAVGGDSRRLPDLRRVQVPPTAVNDPLVVVATITGLVVALFFFALMLGPANPFVTLSTVPLDGRGPNPLLQNHILMAFHPPILYMGYVGFTVPFMFGIAALVTGRFGEGWLLRHPPGDARGVGLPHRRHHPRRVVELRGARLGRLLGVGPGRERVAAAVAHRHRVHPLGDHPGTARDAAGVEPVAPHRDVLPHDPRHVPHPFGRHRLRPRVHAVRHRPVAARVPRRRRGHRHRPRSRGAATSSVRRDGSTPRSRASRRSSPTTCSSPGSRSSCCSARCSRSSPRRCAAPGCRSGEPYFDRMATPIGLALLFLMAAAPALPWRATSGEVVRHRLIVPAWIGGLTMLAAVILGARGLAEVLAYGLGAFADRRDRPPIRARHPRSAPRPRRVARGRARTGDPVEPPALRRASSCTSESC